VGVREGALGPGQLSAAPPARRRRAGAEELAQQAAEAERRLDDLQERLGLRFKRRELLREAMTHTSWINERGDQGRDNERLEYLGDAVLELVAGEYLFSRFPNYDEGQLTQMRSSLVSTVALARLGEQLLLGETLRLGRGAAKSGARRLTSLHANAFEALVGAIFLDQGYRKAGKVFLSRIGDLSAWTDPNFKGRLQALAQERYGAPPQYRTVPAAGDPRSRVYVSQVLVEGHGQLGEGRGGTKQAAEQAAARAAIDVMVAPASKKRRRRAAAVVPPESPPALWAPQAPTTAGGLESLPTTGAIGPGEPAPAGIEAAAEAVEAVPAKRRRRRSPRGRGAAIEAGAAPVAAAPEPPVAESPASPPPGPARVSAPRPQRRSGRGVGVGDLAPPPEAVAEASGGAAVAAPEPAPAKRRRRRPARGRSPESGDATAPSPETPEAPPISAQGMGPAELAPAKRRRRRPSRSRTAVLGEAPERDSGPPPAEVAQPGGAGPAFDRATPGPLASAAAVTGPLLAAASADPEPAAKRTHRGRRGGRRRTGGTVTPAP